MATPDLDFQDFLTHSLRRWASGRTGVPQSDSSVFVGIEIPGRWGTDDLLRYYEGCLGLLRGGDGEGMTVCEGSVFIYFYQVLALIFTI